MAKRPSSLGRSKNKASGIIIKAKVTSSRILEIGQSGIKTEFSNKGTITGKYRGLHWDTVESQINLDGTSSWRVRFIQMLEKGEMIVGEGQGTGEATNTRGLAKLKGEGTIMTSSQTLAELNGKRWICEVDNNMATGSATVRVTFP